MRKIKILFVLAILSLNLLHAQRVRVSPGNTADVDVDKKTKKVLLEKIGEAIRENYYDRTGFEPVVNFLESLKKSDEFKQIDKSGAFSRYVTQELRGFTNDPHFNLLYSPTMFAQALSFQQAAPTAARGRQQPSGPDPDARSNYFMPKVEVLAGNVGYLRLERMADIRSAKPTVDAAMAFLTNADAMMIDVRGNGGGVGGFTPYLASYFFPEGGKLLFSREMPAYDSVTHFLTEKELPVKRFTKPLYILMDRFTGSAARNLAYTLQKHGRAQLVGEATGIGSAGGHSAGLFPLAEGYVATVPIANVVHPVTRSNWSMVGVVPDHASSPEKALEAGHRVAVEQLLKDAPQSLRNELERVLKELQNAGENKEPTEEATVSNQEDYVGQYDVRTVFIKNGRLYFRREGQPELEMKKEGEDLFSLVLPPGVRSRTELPRMRFERDDQGVVQSISFLAKDDSVLSSYKKK